MEAGQNDSETQADTGKDPRTGRFIKGHKPYITKGNESGKRGRPGKDAIHAWEWARSQKPAVLKALVYKAIKGHHPSIELYLAYIDGRPVETFRTTSFNVNASAEDIKDLAEKVEAHRLAFLRELGIGAACTPVAETIADANRTPET